MNYDARDAKQWARETLRDYFVTTTMPFREDLSVDEEGLRHNARHILSLPATGGIYVGSIYQEFTSLTLEERKRVHEVVLDEVAGRKPVMIGVTHNSIPDAVELANHARAHGADLVMIWPPTFGMRTHDGVIEYYRDIARQTDIGICVYASTSTDVGFHLNPDMLVELAKIDAICAVKEASLTVGTYFEAMQKVGDKLVISMPAEEYWLAGRRVFGPHLSSEVLLGSSRPMFCETDQLQLCSQFLEAERSGDTTRASALMWSIRTVANAIFAKTTHGGHEIGLMKAVTSMFGMASGPVRPPISVPSSDGVEHCRRVLIDAGLLAENAPSTSQRVPATVR